MVDTLSPDWLKRRCKDSNNAKAWKTENTDHSEQTGLLQEVGLKRQSLKLSVSDRGRLQVYSDRQYSL